MVAIAVSLAALAPASAQVLYTVTDLGLPNNGMFPFSGAGATGINNAGQVAGTATSVFTGAPPDRAFRYSAGSGIVDLGSLIANGSSLGAAINASGQEVGRSQIAGGGSRAFRYTDGVGMVNLGVLPGFTDSTAGGINDQGTVVGFSGFGVSWARVFRYSDATGLVDLALPAGTTGVVTAAINNTGQIALTASSSAGSVFAAFRYSDGSGYLNLGTLGGTSSRATAISQNGSVVGGSDTATGPGHAFLFTDAVGMIDLGTLPTGTGSVAEGINSLGMIVGTADSASGPQRAFLYEPGVGMSDLNDLIGPGTGWTLTVATSINDSGQIVGSSLHNGNQRAFLLTPVPEPSSLLLLTAAFGAGALTARRFPIARAFLSLGSEFDD
jgi:probable HAF family extracellular repeat protein